MYGGNVTKRPSFFGIGVMNSKVEANIGTLMRTAFLYDASFIFTIGTRYSRHASDTPNAQLSVPLFNYENLEDLLSHMPAKTDLVGVELDPRAVSLTEYKHPSRAVYLLGAEDSGLNFTTLMQCKDIVQIPAVRPYSMNLATAGGVLMYDRYQKGLK